jgi:hypothetical protein
MHMPKKIAPSHRIEKACRFTVYDPLIAPSCLDLDAIASIADLTEPLARQIQQEDTCVVAPFVPESPPTLFHLMIWNKLRHLARLGFPPTIMLRSQFDGHKVANKTIRECLESLKSSSIIKPEPDILVVDKFIGTSEYVAHADLVDKLFVFMSKEAIFRLKSALAILLWSRRKPGAIIIVGNVEKPYFRIACNLIATSPDTEPPPTPLYLPTLIDAGIRRGDIRKTAEEKILRTLRLYSPATTQLEALWMLYYVCVGPNINATKTSFLKTRNAIMQAHDLPSAMQIVIESLQMIIGNKS